jgi:AcrR family transcriptional regulator
VTARRRGRPPKSLDPSDPTTRDRLLEAATDACVAEGFEGVTVAGIAERAGFTATAIYNHFDTKEDLLYAAGRRALQRLAATLSNERADAGAVHDIAAAYLRPDMESTRRLFLELHLAGTRHPELSEHLHEWHREFAKVLSDLTVPGDDASAATVKSLFLLLLGLCQLEQLDAIRAKRSDVAARVDRMVDAIYPRGS